MKQVYQLSIGWVLLGAALWVSACVTPPPKLKEFRETEVEFRFPFSFEIAEERVGNVSLKENQKFIILSAKTSSLEKDLDFIRGSLSDTLVAESAFSNKKKTVGTITYQLLSNRCEKDDLEYRMGIIFHVYSLGVFTLLGIPYGSTVYDYRVRFCLYDLDHHLMKEYSYDYTDKVVQGMYYSNGNYGELVLRKLLDSFYVDLKSDEDQIIDYFSQK